MLLGTDIEIIEINGIKCKEIPDYDGYFAGLDGFIYSTKSNKIKKLKGGTNSKGYKRVTLNGKLLFTHHQIARAWLGERPSSLHQCCHVNDIQTDNRPENLHYGKAGKLTDVKNSPQNGRVTDIEWTNAFDKWFKQKSSVVESHNGWLKNE